MWTVPGGDIKEQKMEGSVGRERNNGLLSSSAVTAALKRICRKTNMTGRITSHSGRKGAAVSALISRVPIVVIQSLGLWGNIDTLQSYLGKAIRENYGVLELIDDIRGWRDKSNIRIANSERRDLSMCQN